MRINQEIRNLIMGISQQPPMTRHAEQLQEQINGLSSEVNGLQKRPPTLFVSDLESIPRNSHIHFIDRDKDEKYIVAFTGNDIKIWDTDGRPKQVRYEGNTRQYITVSNPRTDLKIITIADHSIIVNTKKTTRMKDTRDSYNWDNQDLLVWIRQGAFSRTYSIDLNGGGWDSYYTTPDGSDKKHVSQVTPSFIAKDLKGYKSEWKQEDNWLAIPKRLWTTYKVWDGFNGEHIGAIHKEVGKLSDLPMSAPTNFTVKITGEKSKDDDYYVKYNGTSWKETVCPGLKNEIDKDTMPITLRRNEDGSFTANTVEWDTRTVGDEDSNPEPSFIGYPIRDVFFYRNRLGLIAGESVNLSESNNYFNFWMTSATDIVDTDPIDLSVSHNRISILNHAVAFNQDLYLFSNTTQFVIQSDGILSPKNAHIDQATEYESTPNVRPIGVGKNLYFVSERLGYTSVNEYSSMLDETGARDCQDITNHVPSFIKNHVYKLISNPNEHFIMCLSDGDTKTIYVYKYLLVGQQKVQSSWSRWTFSGNIIGADFIGSTLYLITERNNRVSLERMNITYNTKDYEGEPYRVMLDRKREITNPNGVTVPIDLEKAVMVLDNGLVFESNGRSFKRQPNTNSKTAQKAYIGEPYEFNVELSPLYIKHNEQGITSRTPTYRLNIDRVQVHYVDTGQLDVTVSDSSKRATGRTVGIKTNIVNNHPISTGVLNVPVYCENTKAKIKITNKTPLPCSITSILWSGNMTTRERSV